jgi:saccharopepsin
MHKLFTLCTILGTIQPQTFKINLDKIAVDPKTKRRLGHTNKNSIQLENYYNY